MKTFGLLWAAVVAGLLIPCSINLGAHKVHAAGWERSAASADSAADSDLYKTVAGLDKALFDAVNGCELEKLEKMVAEDLEFYHDKTGLAVGRKVFLEAVKNNLCGKVRRELVAGSLEVYPLAGFGAVEIGVHQFHHPGQAKDDVGEAKFIHVWRLKEGQWQVTRVISFDHGAVNK